MVDENNTHQALRGGTVQDLCRFHHFNHERAAISEQVVLGSNASKEFVYYSNGRRIRGHERADLSQDGNQRRLAKGGRLSSHVWARDDMHVGCGCHLDGVWGEGAP